MKTKLALLFILSATMAFAQAPKLINYQGVARGFDGLPITEVDLGVQFEILRSSVTGSVVYKETQTVHTNTLGLILTQIGKVVPLTTINWGNGPFYLRVSVDVNGGTSYAVLGIQEMMSVPFALHAATIPASYTAATNRLDVGGNTFTLSSTPPTTINTTGVATMTNIGTNNYLIGVPASSISITSTVGAAAAATTGINAFNINIPPSPATSISLSGSAPNLTVNSSGANSFTINVPTKTITATGLAVATVAGNLHNIDVPVLTFAPSSGFLSSGSNGVNITQPLSLTGSALSVGPLSNVVNLSSITPWRQSTGTVTLATLTDKVGIGTAAPTENLQLQTAGATSLSILSGNSNVSELQFGNNTTHGLGRIRYDNTTNTLSVWTGNTADRIYIDPNGNVGIGTNVVVSKLDVLGNIRINNGTGANKLLLGPVGGVNQGYTGIYENSGSLIFSVFKSGATATNFGTANAMDAIFVQTNTGRVGIGSNAPLSRFEVLPLGNTISGTQGQSTFYQDYNTGAAVFAEANNLGTSSGSTNYYSRAMLAGYMSGQTPLNSANSDVGVYGGGSTWGMLAAGGLLSAPTTYAGIAGASYSGVFMGGNFGIGTTTPGAALQVTGGGNTAIFTGGNVGIGTTAPTTPLHVQGTARIVDGTQGANKVLTSDASGNATWENSSRNTGFHAYNGSTQAIPGSFVLVTFPTEEYDIGNNFASSAYTCPSTGFYHFDATMSFSPMTGSGYMFIAIYKNNSPYKYQMSQVVNYYHSIDISVNIPCNQGDIITIQSEQFSGNAATCYGSGNNYTYFSGYRIY